MRTQEQLANRRINRRLLPLVLPVLAVTLALAVLLAIRDSAEAAVASFAQFLPVGYAFGAGMVASVNPCGFFLLPSYISYQLGFDGQENQGSSARLQVARALLLGGTATLGFVIVFAATGVVISAGAQWLARVFPWAGLAIGGLMVVLGAWLLITRRSLGILAASRLTVTPERRTGNVFIFGVVYAIGSLSCTLPIFLVVVGGALSSGGFTASLSQFISYAFGMGSILIAVTVGTALFRDSVYRRLRSAVPYVHRASALFLIGAGVYLIYYWVFFAGLTN